MGLPTSAAYLLPFIFVYTPALILQGQVWDIAFAVICAIAGIWTISAGLAGYFGRSLSNPARLTLICAGLVILYPDFSSTIGVVTSVIGLLLGAGTLGYEYKRSSGAS